METLVPYFLSKRLNLPYKREKLELDDGDFIDLDWSLNNSDTLFIISHGFEGNSKDHFIEQTVDYFSRRGVDLLIWHYRSCGGELNRLPRFYHHGDVSDFRKVIDYASGKGQYNHIGLIGFSMGGNFVINYLGSGNPNKQIKGGIVFSTPMDLSTASDQLSKGFNHKIERSFVEKWKRKIERKAKEFPELIDLDKLNAITTLDQLQKDFLLPLHGFSSQEEYFKKHSSAQFLIKIDVPLLIVNAKNDPLLSPNCYPYIQCQSSENVFLETPEFGGHTGFTRKTNGKLWFIHRIESFLLERK